MYKFNYNKLVMCKLTSKLLLKSLKMIIISGFLIFLFWFSNSLNFGFFLCDLILVHINCNPKKTT